MSVREPQAVLCCVRRALRARAEQMDLGRRDAGGDCLERSEGGARIGIVREEREELIELLGEPIRAEMLARTTQRERRTVVGPGGAAHAEVDAPRMERVQRAKRLGDLE